jgi:uncharacterized caspase-like protein
MADYAFIVGIENYIENSLPQVRYAEADALAVRDALSDLGFTVDSILLSKNATKTNIEHKLTSLFETLTKKDRLLFYYAGYGFACVGHTVLSSAETSSKAPERPASASNGSWITSTRLLAPSGCFSWTLAIVES